LGWPAPSWPIARDPESHNGPIDPEPPAEERSAQVVVVDLSCRAFGKAGAVVRSNTQEKRMLRLAAVALAFATMASPAFSQTGTPSGAGAGQVTVPSGQNSGAGIPGQPGNKNGPSAGSPSATTGAGANSQAPEPNNGTVRQQDSAKIPGQPGSKSGPAAKPPSGSPQR
jgi:hypothetical protein